MRHNYRHTSERSSTDRAFELGIGILAIALAFGCIFLAPSLPPGDSWSAAPAALRHGAFMAHYISNTVVPFRADPWLLGIADLVGSSQFLGTVCALVFGLGIALVQKIGRLDLSFLTCLGIGLVVSTTSLLLFGNDALVFGILAWIPFLALTLAIFAASGYYPVLILAAFFAVRIERSCGVAVLPAITVAAALGWSIAMARFGERERIGSRILIGMLLSAGIGLLALQSSINHGDIAVSFPKYPPTAAVVPHDGSLGTAQLLLGFDTPVAFLNRLAIQEVVYWPAIAVAILTVALAIGVFRQRRRFATSLCFVLPLFGLAIFLECCTFGDAQRYSPLDAIIRILPGANLIPWTLVTLVGGTIALLPIAAQLLSAASIRILTGLSAALLTTLLFRPDITPQRSWAVGALNNLAEEDRSRGMTLLESPSLFLARTEGLQAALGVSSEYLGKLRPLSEFQASLTVSHHPETAKALTDGDLNTRWSAMLGGQDGTEWILVRLPTPQRLAGIQLQPGAFYTDFPRGIRLTVASTCSASANTPSLLSAEGPLETVRDGSLWYGRLNRTADGFPFFTDQPDVSLQLPSSKLIQCVLIEQSSVTKPWDWSVAEVLLAAAE